MGRVVSSQHTLWSVSNLCLYFAGLLAVDGRRTALLTAQANDDQFRNAIADADRNGGGIGLG